MWDRIKSLAATTLSSIKSFLPSFDLSDPFSYPEIEDPYEPPRLPPKPPKKPIKKPPIKPNPTKIIRDYIKELTRQLQEHIDFYEENPELLTDAIRSNYNDLIDTLNDYRNSIGLPDDENFLKYEDDLQLLHEEELNLDRLSNIYLRKPTKANLERVTASKDRIVELRNLLNIPSPPLPTPVEDDEYIQGTQDIFNEELTRLEQLLEDANEDYRLNPSRLSTKVLLLRIQDVEQQILTLRQNTATEFINHRTAQYTRLLTKYVYSGPPLVKYNLRNPYTRLIQHNTLYPEQSRPIPPNYSPTMPSDQSPNNYDQYDYHLSNTNINETRLKLSYAQSVYNTIKQVKNRDTYKGSIFVFHDPANPHTERHAITRFVDSVPKILATIDFYTTQAQDVYEKDSSVDIPDNYVFDYSDFSLRLDPTSQGNFHPPTVAGRVNNLRDYDFDEEYEDIPYVAYKFSNETSDCFLLALIAGINHETPEEKKQRIIDNTTKVKFRKLPTTIRNKLRLEHNTPIDLDTSFFPIIDYLNDNLKPEQQIQVICHIIQQENGSNVLEQSPYISPEKPRVINILLENLHTQEGHSRFIRPLTQQELEKRESRQSNKIPIIAVFKFHSVYDTLDNNIFKTFGYSYATYPLKDPTKISLPFTHVSSDLNSLNQEFLHFISNPPPDSYYILTSFNNAKSDNFVLSKIAAQSNKLTSIFTNKGEVKSLRIKQSYTFDLAKIITSSLEESFHNYDIKSVDYSILIDQAQFDNRIIDTSRRYLASQFNINILALTELVQKSHKSILNLTQIDFFLNKADTSAKIAQQMMSLHQIGINKPSLNNEAEQRVARSVLKGGRNEIMAHPSLPDRPGTILHNKRIYVMDLSGAYQVSQTRTHHEKIPYQFWGLFPQDSATNFTQTYEPDKLAFYLVDVLIQPLINIFPFQSPNHSLDWKYKDRLLLIWITSLEYEQLIFHVKQSFPSLHTDEIVKIHHGYYFNKLSQNMFHAIKDLSIKKDELSLSKANKLPYNKSDLDAAKRVLTSSSGVFAKKTYPTITRLIKTAKDKESFQSKIDTNKPVEFSRLSNKTYIAEGTKLPEPYKKSTSSPCHISALIYSYHRVFMYELLFSKYPNSIYTNTDSDTMYHTDYTHFRRNNPDFDPVTNPGLGSFKEELFPSNHHLITVKCDDVNFDPLGNDGCNCSLTGCTNKGSDAYFLKPGFYAIFPPPPNLPIIKMSSINQELDRFIPQNNITETSFNNLQALYDTALSLQDPDNVKRLFQSLHSNKSITIISPQIKKSPAKTRRQYFYIHKKIYLDSSKDKLIFPKEYLTPLEGDTVEDFLDLRINNLGECIECLKLNSTIHSEIPQLCTYCYKKN